MLTNTQLREYKKLRSKGHTAYSAKSIATAKPDNRLEWSSDSSYMPTATWEQEGFTLVATTFIDEDADLSFYGKFTDRESDTTVRNPDGYLQGHYKFIELEYSEQQHYKDLIDAKYGKAQARELAREYTQQDIDRLMDYEHGNWHMLVMKVSAYKAGIELGTAYLSGIESDCEDRYLTDIALEEADEAIHEAKDNLRLLRKAD